MLQSAVIKISLREPARRITEMLAAMRSFGVEQVHLVHVRAGNQKKFYKRKHGELEGLREQAAELGLEAEKHVLEGHPSTRILQASWQLDADFIAIPWVKKAVLQQALLGSIDEDIVRMSDMPVFIFKQGFLSRTESLDS
ncbi:MAG: universal stress protein, partial [Desulfovibrionaceae bacterium]